ncbi:tight junction protein ZO-1 isoform X3 [Chrysoperla carnea]|uniref:tight junction protein ZO-1 isoform X3 n=1 Tax=Chrysoperla carnea TaxID=189513 RepID=UPI001D0773E7|nr:tight junction protein ZO-1 isoform X3 [Chrysoperla carnea]
MMDSMANNVMTNAADMQGWEYRQVTVTRVPGYGFGIAVSGGRDNPHFSSGDPSIAVSDVLTQGPAERLLQVNDRILSVNGISLQNVDYATAVQVLRDSGDTVVLSIKRRVSSQSNHQHSHSATYSLTSPTQNVKITLTKNSKKEDFGIVLGCKLFIKEISSKTRDQLSMTNQHLMEGDFITKLNNTNCNDLMSLKEAKKIIDGCKDKINIYVARDGAVGGVMHQPQSSISTTGAVNNYYNKGEDLFVPNQSYSNQNLYVQPPTRHSHQHTTSYTEENAEDKSNLVPRGGRLRGPLNDNVNLSRELEAAVTNRQHSREPPRPPPPRPEDYYASRRQLYDEDPLLGKSKQTVLDARFIAFQKEGSVGIRLTGGNHSGIFVTAVQPGSPASLQGLQPGDKILKVNDMDMTGVTREEAVLFLLSLQDRIELIVQLCKDEYDAIVASQKGDSFYIKTHFHYESPVKGEMTFRSGDIFHVIDTLYNGVVGCWQVYRIGRNNQEVQKGIIPNKARAEELATAQFNATKKEMSANESRGSFFRRRRSSNRRSKSLGKEHWDDILFSDSVSKFPAYERVVLRHPGFMRPVILFGPIADMAREKLLKDFPDKFISPQLENGMDESQKPQKSSHIIRLSAIRDVISTGKHALLDITPNAVERLNYAQLYPIVVFLKADSKIVIKQLRQGLPKSAHKSSKKLLEQCTRLDKVWSHVFGATITLSDSSEHWYRKLREILDRQQANALWMSETKLRQDFISDIYFPPPPPLPRSASIYHRYSLGSSSLPNHYYRSTSQSHNNRRAQIMSFPTNIPPPPRNRCCSVSHYYTPPEESLSDDFLFPMSSLRLSYASSPESDLEHSPGPPGASAVGGVMGSGALTTMNTSPSGRLTKASSDPSINLPSANSPPSDHDVPPPYQATYDSKYGFAANSKNESENKQGNSIENKKIPLNENSQESLSTPTDTNYKSTNPLIGNGLYGQTGGATSQQIPNEISHHERQKSSIHGSSNFTTPTKSSFNRMQPADGSPSRSPRINENNMYAAAPDLPPRIDRGVKPSPSGGLTKGGTAGRSAHERLFGTKAPGHDNNDMNSLPLDSNFKGSPLERRGPGGDNSKLSSIPDMKHDKHHSSGNNGSSRYSSSQENQHSPRSSLEMQSEHKMRSSENIRHHDMYRYNKMPGKQMPNRIHFETKTDYGKYSRNNSNQDYLRKSQYELNSTSMNNNNSGIGLPQSGLLTATPSMQHLTNGLSNSDGLTPHSNTNGTGNNNSYKPIPPPKPKNYKPPFKNPPNGGNYGDESQMGMPPSSPPMYQHGKSNSHPAQMNDQRSPNYYYNIPPSAGTWHGGGTETNGTHFAQPIGGLAPPYEHRHAGDGMHFNQDYHRNDYNRFHSGETPEQHRNNIVDLQGSREQRGSAFELYRKPIHHNMSSMEMETDHIMHVTTNNSSLSINNMTNNHICSSQSSLDEQSSMTNTNHKHHDHHDNHQSQLQSASHHHSDNHSNDHQSTVPAVAPSDYLNANNDVNVTSATVDHRGGRLENKYWGVSLDIPEGAIPEGIQQHIYFVITDPRTCDNAPPLDFENGETLLSPLVMCGPQGLEFKKSVILNIPHYAHTLPSLAISLKATNSERDLCTDWDNILLPSNHTANSVAVKVDHF